MSDYGIRIMREQFQFAHQWLEDTMQGVTSQVAHWQPQGLATPIAAQYAHVLTTEDLMVNTLARGSAMLAESRFVGQTGFIAQPSGDWREWSQSLQLDLDQARHYAQALYAETDAYLATINDAALFEEVDAALIDLEMLPRWDVLNLILVDLLSHAGEIATLKGLQGLKGYTI